MIFSGLSPVCRISGRIFPRLILAVAVLSLAACAPVKPTPTEPEVASATPPDSLEVVEPAEPELVCPEPEPVEPVICPPPPKPKPCPVCPVGKIDGKLLLGSVEYVKITPPGVVYKARIDSGAEGTSIHADNIVRFERDGEKWVKFDLEAKDGKSVTLERQVLRSIRVRQADKPGRERRVVVMLSLSIGPLTEQLEMSLNDRSDMEHPVLIGRNFLHNNAIVDVSQRHIAK